MNLSVLYKWYHDFLKRLYEFLRGFDIVGVVFQIINLETFERIVELMVYHYEIRPIISC